MANGLNAKPGSKISIAYDVPIGVQPEFTLMSTFKEDIDDSTFLMSVPFGSDGKPVPMDDDQKFLMRVGSGMEAMIMAGYIDDEIVDGYHTYWKVRRVTELRQFLKRADERYKCALKLQYYSDSWEPNTQGKIEPLEAMTLDISGGGAAMFINTRFDVGEVIELNFPRVGRDFAGEGVSNVVAAVCWYKEAPKGAGYRHICGVQYRFEDSLERERMKIYCEAVRQTYKIKPSN